MEVVLAGYRHLGASPRAKALEFIWRLATTAAARQAFFAQRLRAFGLPGVIAQYSVLRDIYFSEHRMLSQAQIMRIRLVSSANVTKLIHGLEQAGLVRREVNPEDKRSTLVHLTESGLELCERLVPAISHDTDVLLDCFSDAELGILNELLARLQAHIDEDLDTGRFLTQEQNEGAVSAGTDENPEGN
jgi:DNA-binding MarR family transcriptional regulator